MQKEKYELNFVIESTTSSLFWLKPPSRRWRKKWYVSSLPLSEYDSFPPLLFFWEYSMDHDFCYRTLSPKHLLTISLLCLSLSFYRLWKISRNANGQMRTLVETFSFWRKNWPLISRILRMFFSLSLITFLIWRVCSKGHMMNIYQSWRRDTCRGRPFMNRMTFGKRTLPSWMRRITNNSSQFKSLSGLWSGYSHLLLEFWFRSCRLLRIPISWPLQRMMSVNMSSTMIAERSKSIILFFLPHLRFFLNSWLYRLVTELGAKARVMDLMTHSNPEVRYRALLSVQQLVSQPWIAAWRFLSPFFVFCKIIIMSCSVSTIIDALSMWTTGCFIQAKGSPFLMVVLFVKNCAVIIMFENCSRIKQNWRCSVIAAQLFLDQKVIHC